MIIVRLMRCGAEVGDTEGGSFGTPTPAVRRCWVLCGWSRISSSTAGGVCGAGSARRSRASAYPFDIARVTTSLPDGYRATRRDSVNGTSASGESLHGPATSPSSGVDSGQHRLLPAQRGQRQSEVPDDLLPEGARRGVGRPRTTSEARLVEQRIRSNRAALCGPAGRAW